MKNSNCELRRRVSHAIIAQQMATFVDTDLKWLNCIAHISGAGFEFDKEAKTCSAAN